MRVKLFPNFTRHHLITHTNTLKQLKYGNFKKRLHEILTQMLKDKDKYIEPLAILQQQLLKFF